MTFLLYVGLLTLVVTASADYEEKIIACDSDYRISSGDTFEFTYSGAFIKDPCILKIREDDDLFGSRICIAMTQKGDLCGKVKVEYHSHFYTSIPDREIDCSTSSLDVYEEYCPLSSRVDIALVDRTGTSWTTPMKIKVYLKSSSNFHDVSSIVKTSVYLIIGIVIGCIVIMIILVVVVVVCCCRRQRSSGGTVYRSPQMASATTTTQANYSTAYPPQQQQYIPPQAGYQPQGYPAQTGYLPGQQTGYPPGQQTGYPPQQQAGYQPQQQTGYPSQPQAGYPPAAQQGYAGYQTAPASEKPPMASAPPMEMYPMQSMEPPPYPGN